MLGIRQAVRHRTLTPAYGSPNLPSPTKFFICNTPFRCPAERAKSPQICENDGEVKRPSPSRLSDCPRIGENTGVCRQVDVQP